MLRDTTRKLKFQALARRLGSRVLAIGHLELLWHATARDAPDGAIGRFTDEEIEAACEWPGEPGVLIEALVATRWLDRLDGDARLYVHDWHEHADYQVHRKIARARGLFANGAIPKLGTLEKHERPSAEECYAMHPEHPRNSAGSLSGGSCGSAGSPRVTRSATRGGSVKSLQEQEQEQEQEEERIRRGSPEAGPPRGEEPVDWNPIRNLLGPFRATPPPEPDERDAWLEQVGPELEHAATAAISAKIGSENPPRKAVIAEMKRACIARWRHYLGGPRDFRGAAEQRRAAEKAEAWEREHRADYDAAEQREATR